MTGVVASLSNSHAITPPTPTGEAGTDHLERSEHVALAKLVVVGPSPPPVHGVVVMTEQMLRALRQLGACAGHLDTRDPRPVTTIGRLDVRNVILGLQHAWQLNRLLVRRRDAIGVHLSISQVTWGFLRDAVLIGIVRLRRRRLYVHLHGGLLAEFYRESARPMRWLIRKVLREAYQAWVLTPSLRSQFHGLVAEDRVHCVSNVVDDPLARELQTPSAERRRTDGLRILYLANLLPEKGCFDVLAALRLLAEESSGWEVRLVGPAGPGVEQRLRAEIAALPKDAARVKLVGEITGAAKSEQYRWADVFVYPTRYPPEGQPLVLLEALGAGLPVLSTRWAGIPDTVEDCREGLLIEPGDEHALAAALSRLAHEPSLRKTFSVNARARYDDCYRPERLVRDLSRLLKD
jgi:glycosyltransferase involved in cell wall biosynthesis